MRFIEVATVLAQTIPNPKPDPNAPGAKVVSQLIGYAKYLGLGIAVLAGIAAVIIGGAARMSGNVTAQGSAARGLLLAAGIGFGVTVVAFVVQLAVSLGGSL